MGQTCGCAEYGANGEKEEVLSSTQPKVNNSIQRNNVKDDK